MTPAYLPESIEQTLMVSNGNFKDRSKDKSKHRLCSSSDQCNRSVESSADLESLDADVLFALGNKLEQEERFTDALTCLNQALRKRPEDPAILAKLATTYHRAEQFLPALRAYDHLIELGLADATIWCETGNALTDVGEYAQAIGAYQNSLDLNSNNPEAHHNLSRVLYRLGQVDEAASQLRICASQCDSIDPWLSLATIIPGCPKASQKEILKVRQTFGYKLAECSDIEPLTKTRPVSKSTDRVLKIGYLSEYFHSANYMKPVWGLINHHDRTAFEIHLFSDSPADKKLTGYAEHPKDRLHETGTLTNNELIALIQSCEIDILVDLNAYSTAKRLALFLQHASPVVIAWFNMYATSGLPGFDYIIGDDHVVRQGEEPFYTEQVMRLPMSYLTFDVDYATPPVVSPPYLDTGTLTFGSLVSQYKITPMVFDTWAEILKKTENTRLFLANSTLKSKWNREYVRDQFIQRDINPNRLILEGPAEHFDFLQYYNRIDVALDAFPYNGGTTTMEAIWQGIPVLTFQGDRWASRTSQSLLQNTHLGYYVTSNITGLINCAQKMAQDPSTPIRLKQLREKMRDRLQTSSVCDTQALARHMEQLYRTAWYRKITSRI
jgi:predicted O-linked N-acetylglucosamine transferase (SPINDLY family)